MHSRRGDLDWINDEVLAQNRLSAFGAHLVNVLEATVETIGFGQHTDRRSVGSICASQETRRIRPLDDCSQGRGSGLALHDDGRAAGARLDAVFAQGTGAQGVFERTLGARKREGINLAVGLVELGKARAARCNQGIKDCSRGAQAL